ncbi:MAG: hypothetical protein M1820_002429 [Bogoriella megaspora]|nr:MAG: hypothetical protein M1820_002429 [Bogoriella megaspora]
MSSGFVSGGTIDNPVEHNDEWVAAQKELEAKRQREKEQASQPGGKSLYETLQENKAKKQEAYEESIRLKNQFKTLDEEEVSFLDEVIASERAKEVAIKKETKDQLELFKQRQDKAAKVELDKAGSPSAEDEQWAKRSRKRKQSGGHLPGVKLRKSSSGGLDKSARVAPNDNSTREPDESIEKVKNHLSPAASPHATSELPATDLKASSPTKSAPQPVSEAKVSNLGGLGLVGYTSDESD